MITIFNELKNNVKFVSDKYDDLLSQIQAMNAKSLQQRTDIKNVNSDISTIKQDLQAVKKQATDAILHVEEIGRYLRRDCLEIAGIKATSECSAEAIVESVGKAIGVLVNKEDISIAHPIPSYNTAAQPKIIVKFTRRSVRNTFIQTGKSWPAREQVTFRTLILNPMQTSTSPNPSHLTRKNFSATSTRKRSD